MTVPSHEAVDGKGVEQPQSRAGSAQAVHDRLLESAGFFPKPTGAGKAELLAFNDDKHNGQTSSDKPGSPPSSATINGLARNLSTGTDSPLVRRQMEATYMAAFRSSDSKNPIEKAKDADKVLSQINEKLGQAGSNFKIEKGQITIKSPYANAFDVINTKTGDKSRLTEFCTDDPIEPLSPAEDVAGQLFSGHDPASRAAIENVFKAQFKTSGRKEAADLVNRVNSELTNSGSDYRVAEIPSLIKKPSGMALELTNKKTGEKTIISDFDLDAKPKAEKPRFDFNFHDEKPKAEKPQADFSKLSGEFSDVFKIEKLADLQQEGRTDKLDDILSRTYESAGMIGVSLMLDIAASKMSKSSNFRIEHEADTINGKEARRIKLSSATDPADTGTIRWHYSK